MTNIYVFRLGHRFSRDKRITTHIALVARAFGAKAVVFDIEDNRVKDSVYKICDKWGYGPSGDFEIFYEKNWRKFIKDFDGIKIHLTMYGFSLSKVKDKILKDIKDKNILIVVGGQKVPGEIYNLVDYNVGIGNQPHSEVGALAVFLHELNAKPLDENEWNCKKNQGKKRIFPQKKGKKVAKR